MERKPSLPKSWGGAAEVVIVGYGAAGAVAAITAHDLGRDILILEKQPSSNHVSTSHMSLGGFVSVNNVPAAIKYMEQLAKVAEELYWTDRDVIRVWAEYTSQNKEWIEKLGGKVRLLRKRGEHDLPGTESIELYMFPGLGHGFMRFLKRQVESRGVQVLYEATADKLLTNAKGEVIGVRVKNHGKELNIKASRAVIMAPGGFEFNEEMKLNYLKVYPSFFLGSPSTTGDGIKMVQEIGASLWHMNCVSAGLVLKFDGSPFALGANFMGSKGFLNRFHDETLGSQCGYIIVDKYGKRYTNEEFRHHAVYYELALYDSRTLEYPRVPSYWIFDRKRIEAGPLPSMDLGPMQTRLFNWSRDNSAEIEKGWIIQGRNLKELARKLKILPSVLEETVQNYNTHCKQKEDPEFHRAPQHLVSLSEPPFFAVKLWPGGANTQGGPRRNRKSQILDTSGGAIHRLYAAGEFGSIYGMLYPSGGGNLAECIAFGRIAGQNAAKESPWK